MMTAHRRYFMLFCLCCCLASCSTALAQHHLDKFLLGVPAKTTIGSSTINKLSKPVDLDFNKLPGRTNELWVLNRDNTAGSTMSVFYHVGTPQVKMEKRVDSHRGHFMINSTAFEMDGQGNFATVQEVQNTTGSGTFMGPALWSSDTSIFARMNQNDWVAGELLGSHLDMLHQSPFGMGVAHEKDNIYWVFDGHNKNLCRYDFQEPHIVGGDDHSDGKVWRYTEVSLTRKSNLPAHMIIDKKTGWLYIVDNSKKRVIRVDINSGEESTELTASNEPLEEYWRMKNVKWEVYIDSGLTSPCGIDVRDNRLIVSDNSNGDIILYNTDGAKGTELGRIKTGFAGIMGVKVGPDSNIWYVNFTRNEAIRLTPDTKPGAPQQVYPANNAVAVGLTDTLKWLAAFGATQYSIQLSDTVDFSHTIADVSVGNNLYYALAGLDSNKSYYWRVQSSSTEGSSAWSATWQFTTVGQTMDVLDPVIMNEIVTLAPSFPNPVSGTSTISFNSKEPMHITLELWNSLGVRISTLFEGIAHGEHSVITHTAGLPTGAYYYVLQTPVTQIRRQFVKLAE